MRRIIHHRCAGAVRIDPQSESPRRKVVTQKLASDFDRDDLAFSVGALARNSNAVLCGPNPRVPLPPDTKPHHQVLAQVPQARMARSDALIEHKINAEIFTVVAL